MATLTYFKNNYNQEHIHKTLVHYILHPKIYNADHHVIGYTTARLYGGHNLYFQNILADDGNNIDRVMMNTLAFYGKDASTCLLHFSINYDTPNTEHLVCPELAWQHADFICKKQLFPYQCLFTIHENTDHLHTHFVINSIDLNTGLKIHAHTFYKNLVNFINNNKFLQENLLNITVFYSV